MTCLLVMCKVLGQSPLQLDQYRSSIKSLVLLYLSDYTYDYSHTKNDSTITQPSDYYNTTRNCTLLPILLL